MPGRVITRGEHVAWCKARATEYVDHGDLTGAFTSMASDLQKHDETRDHAGMELGFMLLMAGHLATEQQMRKFIDGFN